MADISSDWVDKQRQDGLIITTGVMTGLSILFVLLRSVSRFIVIRNPGPDDYLIIGAMLLTIGYLICLCVGKDNHMGYPMTMLTPDNMQNILKATLAIQVMYYTNVCCIKTSILFTYLRFAVSKSFRVLCTGTIALLVVFWFVCFVTTLVQCRPIYKMWDLMQQVDGTCINTTAFFYFTSSFNIVTDVWILALPIKTLSAVNRPQHEKLVLFAIFGVGTFACVASIVRLHTIYTYTLAADPFHESLKVNLWSIIEVTIAICCASVPALKPIFSSSQRRKTRVARDPTYGSTSRWTRNGPGGSRWHIRLGSKDHSADEKLRESQSSGSPRGTQAQQRPETGRSVPPQGSQPRLPHQPSPAPATEMSLGPPSPPTPQPRPVGLSPEDKTGSEDSMIPSFTPMSPPPRAHQEASRQIMPHMGDSGMSSSGSMIVLQK